MIHKGRRYGKPTTTRGGCQENSIENTLEKKREEFKGQHKQKQFRRNRRSGYRGLALDEAEASGGKASRGAKLRRAVLENITVGTWILSQVGKKCFAKVITISRRAQAQNGRGGDSTGCNKQGK